MTHNDRPADVEQTSPPPRHDATHCDVCQAWLAHVHQAETS